MRTLSSYISVSLSFLICVSLLLASCSQPDPMVEINKLVDQGKVVQAKVKFKELVDADEDPNLERKYIQFLYDQKQFHDFKREATAYLAKTPEDKEIKYLQFEFFAEAAEDAERQKNYELAKEYIVVHLLSPDYQNYRKWESRLGTVLKKWYNDAEAEKGAEAVAKRKRIVSEMINLGYEQLAKTVAPELVKEVAEGQTN